MTSFRCSGVRIDACTITEAITRVLARDAQSSAAVVHLCNAYSIALAANNDLYRNVLDGGDINLPDGMPLVWIARLLRIAACRRPVRGTDLLRGVVDAGRSAGRSHYFYGATAEVLDSMCIALETEFPGTVIAGKESPPFRQLSDAELDELAERLSSTAADYLWIGLGTPKQDFLAEYLRSRIQGTLINVGAAFDFVSGNKREAPVMLRRLGLEWLFRLVSEPRRLWRRYLVGNLVFIKSVLRDRPRRIS